MTCSAMPDDSQLALAPLDEKVDHVRGSPAGRLILEYGDYECPYSRQAFHAIEQVERQLGGNMRFAFRHFPLTGIHPHALAAAAAAEAAARQGRFWDMHELLFHRARCSAPPPCSSTAWCTAAATTRPPCWPRWAHERALLAYGQHQADRRAVPVRAARGVQERCRSSRRRRRWCHRRARTRTR